MTIRAKLLLTIIPPIILGILALGYISSNLVKTNTINQEEKLISLYSDRLIHEHIERRVKLLETTGLNKVPSYVSNYKVEALKGLHEETHNNNIKIFILDEKKEIKESLSHSHLSTTELWTTELKKRKNEKFNKIIHYVKDGTSGYYYLYYYHKQWEWDIFIYESDERLNKFFNDIENIVLFAMFLIVIIVSLLVYVVTNRMILQSIYKLQHSARQISKGNLAYKININTNDEIGEVAQEFEEMRKTLKKRIDLFNEQLHFRQLLINAINIPIYIKDKNLEFISCNNAYLRLVGLANRDNSNFENLELNQKFRITELEVLSKNQDISKNLIVKNADGNDIEIILSNNLFYDNKNEVSGIVGSIFDTTQINEAKHKIENFNIELQSQVKEQTKELIISNKELEESFKELQLTQKELVEAEKMASLGELVAGVAHEINTPIGIGLTGITHFTTLLTEMEKKYNNEEMSEEEFEEFILSSKTLANLIQINLTRTAQLVKSFKQISVDQASEQERNFHIKDYLNEIITSLTNILKHTSIKIELNCDNSLFIKSHPGFISQIFTNLILNSANHGFEKNEQGTIEITILNEDNNLRIIYKDNGKGISKANLQKIYEPFFTTKRNNGGTGLGLNIIYNLIVKKFEGTIKCRSEENQGVEFNILLTKLELL